MRFALLAMCALSLLLRPPAHAGGINLSWSDCGLAGTMNRSFACNTNVGAHQMVASFDPSQSLSGVVNAVGIIDLCTGGVPLPPWWTFINPGSCRPTALSASAAYIGGSFQCADHWSGQGFATIGAYQVGYDGWDSARILVHVWTTQYTPGPVEPGTEYHAFTVNILNTATVGESACGGCSVGACIVLNEIQIWTQGGGEVITATRDRNYLHWQGATVFNCPFVVPVQNRTWGQVKSLYR